MAGEPFEVTDDKGNTVTGTVDVFRDPRGPYFDPKSEYYMHPRYADAHFDYFNTREACTIDRDVLSRAMQDAFAKALTRFGIENPGRAKIAQDVDASINATRQQCIRNADKYVSNETFSSSSWETGEAVGNLTARAYAAVPAPDGGIQTVVARENSWPAADVLTLKNDGGANARILSRRVAGSDGGNSVENWGASQTQKAPPPNISGFLGISDSTKPMRYLGRSDGNVLPASVFDTGAPAAQFVLPDQVNSFRDPTGGAAAELSANKPQASMVDPDAPGASLAPSGSPSLMGGLAGRIAALAGIDPDNPDRPVPPPGGLLALLLAAQQR